MIYSSLWKNQRLKLNKTFNLNIELIRNQKDIEQINKQFKIVEKIENDIENFKFKKDFDIIEEDKGY